MSLLLAVAAYTPPSGERLGPTVVLPRATIARQATSTPSVTDSDVLTVTPTPPPPATETPWSESPESLTATAAYATRLTTTPHAGPITATPLPPSPGMAYRAPDGLWRIDFDWQPVFLTIYEWAIPAFGSTRALYEVYGNIWMQDLPAGETRNLTNTPDLAECCPQWWSARPEYALIGLNPETSWGYLSLLNLDTGVVTPLETDAPGFAPPAPAPDGRRIAYDASGAARIYTLDEGIAIFDPLAYSLPAGIKAIPIIASPSWSPDSKRLAWIMSIKGPDYPVDSFHIAIGVFDLEQGTSVVLHPHSPLSRDSWWPAASWSPAGRWLAFTAWVEDPAERGLWVMAADGSEEHYLGDGDNPHWSPAGRWLYYEHYELGHRLVEVETWYELAMYLPDGSTVVSWRP